MRRICTNWTLLFLLPGFVGVFYLTLTSITSFPITTQPELIGEEGVREFMLGSLAFTALGRLVVTGRTLR